MEGEVGDLVELAIVTGIVGDLRRDDAVGWSYSGSELGFGLDGQDLMKVFGSARVRWFQ